MVLLYVNDKNGEVFVRTDQMDGETDCKFFFLNIINLNYKY